MIRKYGTKGTKPAVSRNKNTIMDREDVEIGSKWVSLNVEGEGRDVTSSIDNIGGVCVEDNCEYLGGDSGVKFWSGFVNGWYRR